MIWEVETVESRHSSRKVGTRQAGEKREREGCKEDGEHRECKNKLTKGVLGLGKEMAQCAIVLTLQG